jgi:hypothetical protein
MAVINHNLFQVVGSAAAPRIGLLPFYCIIRRFLFICYTHSSHSSPVLNTIRGGYLALGRARRRSCTLCTARRRNNAQGEKDPRSVFNTGELWV